MAMGLFDVEGGAAVKPTYQITAPVFDRVTIHLNPDYFARRDFTIVTRNNRPQNIYIQRAWLNGKPLERCWFDHADLVRGGKLEIELGPEANRAWGLRVAGNKRGCAEGRGRKPRKTRKTRKYEERVTLIFAN